VRGAMRRKRKQHRDLQRYRARCHPTHQFQGSARANTR
jgi:hypothetical protein